jgi:hypothetical protein
MIFYRFLSVTLSAVIATVVLLVLVPVIASADPAIDRFKTLGKDRICLAQLVPVDFQFAAVMRAWFSDPESRLYLPTAFDTVVARHRTFMLELEAYAKGSNETPADLPSLRKAIEGVEQQNIDLGLKLKDISGIDENFISSLNSVARQLGMVTAATASVQTRCAQDPEITTALASIVEEVKKAGNSLSEMRHYMGQIQSKRFAMLDSVTRNVENRLKVSYATLTSEKLEAIEASVEGVFGLLRFIDDLETWWFRVAIGKGTARGYLATTFQYRQALSVLELDAKTLRSFQKRLDTIRSPDGAKETAQNLINSKLKFLEIARDEAVAAGWNGFIANQTTVTKRFLQLRNDLVDDCNRAVDAYLALPADNAQLANRVAKDRAFVAVSTLCRKGKK